MSQVSLPILKVDNSTVEQWIKENKESVLRPSPCVLTVDNSTVEQWIKENKESTLRPPTTVLL